MLYQNNSIWSDKTINNETISSSPKIPFWERYTLSIEEAAAYFRIGENKLRKIVSDDRDADYILWNGNRPQIKRKLFERHVDRLCYI